MKGEMNLIKDNVAEPYDFRDSIASTTGALNPSDYKIDLTEPVPDPHPLLSIRNSIIASPGNFVVIKGGAKAAKSFCVGACAAAFISNRNVLNITSEPIGRKSKVIYLDNEQSLSHVHKLAKRIHQLAGLDTDRNNPHFEVYYLKELDTFQRFDILRMVVADPDVGIVILDGAVDIVLDFNDLQESTKVLDELMQMVGSNQIALIVVIHTNKKDANSRGHYGAMLEQKSETTILLSKQDAVFNATAAYTRNAPFEDFQFMIDGDGLPVQVDIKNNKKALEAEKKRKVFASILEGQKTMDYGEVVNNYCEVSGVSEATAKRHIGKAVMSKWIKKGSSGGYSFNPTDSNE